MEEIKTYYKFRPDEIFRRITMTSLATLMIETSKLEYQEEDAERLSRCVIKSQISYLRHFFEIRQVRRQRGAKGAIAPLIFWILHIAARSGTIFPILKFKVEFLHHQFEILTPTLYLILPRTLSGPVRTYHPWNSGLKYRKLLKVGGYIAE